jgi:transposase-like protein
MLERLHREINRRSRVARIITNKESLLRLVSAIEMEISEDWLAEKRYLTMETENESESADSNDKKIYRKKLLNLYQLICSKLFKVFNRSSG